MSYIYWQLTPHLQLVHPWIVDTSVIYHHTRGPPFKASLKWLANKWLEKEIQQPRKTGELAIVGHNSEEDARAAVELLRLKMERGELRAYCLNLISVADTA
jgi:RNA exonuclease 1